MAAINGWIDHVGGWVKNTNALYYEQLLHSWLYRKTVLDTVGAIFRLNQPQQSPACDIDEWVGYTPRHVGCKIDAIRSVNHLFRDSFGDNVFAYDLTQYPSPLLEDKL